MAFASKVSAAYRHAAACIAMPIPHRVFLEIAKRRLKGNQGERRLAELNRLISELPGYYTGPYAQVRTWLQHEVEQVRRRKSTQHASSFAVRKQGDVQVAVVGYANAGKSSLLKALTGSQVKVGGYVFTTTKPVPATLEIGGALVQLVEVPGLLDAQQHGDRHARELLSVARAADAIIIVHDLSYSPGRLSQILLTLQAEKIASPLLIAANKCDLAESEQNLSAIRTHFPLDVVVPISAEHNIGLEDLKTAIWTSLDRIRVFTKDRSGTISRRPLVLPRKSTVRDLAMKMPRGILDHFHYARVWGSSAKFAGQQVGFMHELSDLDIVQIHS